MTVFLVDIEAVDTRYTGQWKTHVPELLRMHGLDVTVIFGPKDVPAATTPGAFLNFGGTNIYKAKQVETISQMFCAGVIKDGDYFLFTDAWHPGIINLKYMASLLNINIKIGALWHAGSYDPQDFLGRLIGNEPWVRHAEKSFFHAIDHNYFATDFHIDMFCLNLLGTTSGFAKEWIETGKIVRTGWPMEYMSETLDNYRSIPKRDLILFPHRIAPEKQVEIFRDLALQLPQYEFIVCQDKTLTKHEYHTLLGQSKMVFSASLQETLGIGCYEALCVDSMPLVPNRLSYSEMYYNHFKYPSEWTASWDSYCDHKNLVIEHISAMMDSYDDDNASMPQRIRAAKTAMESQFFAAHELINTIKANV